MDKLYVYNVNSRIVIECIIGNRNECIDYAKHNYNYPDYGYTFSPNFNTPDGLLIHEEHYDTVNLDD